MRDREQTPLSFAQSVKFVVDASLAPAYGFMDHSASHGAIGGVWSVASPRAKRQPDWDNVSGGQPRWCPDTHSPGILAQLEGSEQTGTSTEDRACIGASMLPLTVQFIVSMLACAINNRMSKRVEYLHEEVRVPREVRADATGSTRIRFTPDQRRRLAIKGRALTPTNAK